MHKMFKNTRLTILIAGLFVFSTHKVFCPQEEQEATQSLENLQARCETCSLLEADNAFWENQVHLMNSRIVSLQQEFQQSKSEIEKKNQQLEISLGEYKAVIESLRSEISRFCEQGANQVDVVELANLIEANARLRMRNARLEQQSRDLSSRRRPDRAAYLREVDMDLQDDQYLLTQKQDKANVDSNNNRLLQKRLTEKERELAEREQGLAVKEELVNRVTGSNQRLSLELPEADSTLTTLRKSRASIGDEKQVLNKYQSILAKEVATQQAREALTPAARAELERQRRADEDKRFEELLQESANRYQMYDKAISSVE